ncbi:hypothetical protein [Brevibacillus aydinogluensis]
MTLAPGNVHALGIKNDNTLWAWGYNAHGALGTGENTPSTKLPVRVLGF